MTTNFELLMLSQNLLKFQIPIMVYVGVVERVSDDQFPTYDAESKFTKLHFDVLKWVLLKRYMALRVTWQSDSA